MLPLNGMSSTAWGSPKSATQPTFGQTSISSAGTPQNFEYIADFSTRLSFVLKPRFCSVWLTISASSDSGLPVTPTICSVAAGVLPLG